MTCSGCSGAVEKVLGKMGGKCKYGNQKNNGIKLENQMNVEPIAVAIHWVHFEMCIYLFAIFNQPLKFYFSTFLKKKKRYLIDWCDMSRFKTDKFDKFIF